MAQIPQLDISTRKLAVAPNIRFAQGIYGQMAKVAGKSLENTGRSVTQAAHILDKMQEDDARRDSELALQQANDFIANNAIGHDEVNEKTGETEFVPGRLQMTAKEMRAQGTDSVRITRDILKELHQQDFYKNLSPRAKLKFRRRIGFIENKWMRHASENDYRARVQDRVDKTMELIQSRANSVRYTFADKTDKVFNQASTSAAFRNVLSVEDAAIENIEEFDNVVITPENAKELFGKIKWAKGVSEEHKSKSYDQFLKGVVDFNLKRITELQTAAAKNQSLGDITPEDALDKAQKMIENMNKLTLNAKEKTTGKNLTAIDNATKSGLLAENERARKLMVDRRQIELDTKRKDVIQRVQKSCDSLVNIPKINWENSYRVLSEDKELKTYAPDEAAKYAKWADEIKRSGVNRRHVTEREQEAWQNDIEAQVIELETGRWNGRFTEEEAQKRQLELWKNYRVGVVSGYASPKFQETFQKRMTSTLDQQTQRGVQEFLREFGYRGEVGKGGTISANQKKENADLEFYAPHAVDDKHDKDYFAISAADLFSMTEELRVMLEGLPKDANREAAAKEAVSAIKRRWWRAKNKEKLARNVRNITEAVTVAGIKARQEEEFPNTKVKPIPAPEKGEAVEEPVKEDPFKDAYKSGRRRRPASQERRMYLRTM